MPTINFKYLLVSLIILVFAIPSLNRHTLSSHSDLLEMVFATSLIFAVLSLIQHAKKYFLGILVALFAIVCALIAIFTELSVFTNLMLIAAIIFFVVGTIDSVYQVFMVRKGVNFNKILGAICIYIFLALIWSIFYQFLENLIPGSFNGLSAGLKHTHFNDLVYYSLVTITTLGYGDITPATPLAKALVIIEVIVGVFYIAILVAALVGDFMATKAQSKN